MKMILCTFWALLIPVIAGAQQTNENWVFVMELPRLIREQVPKVQLGCSKGTVSTDKLGSSVLGWHNAIYTIKSADGFAPKLIKTAIDGWCKDKFSRVFSSSTGSRENGFVSYAWAYHHMESGIVGRLTIWFPDTEAKPMKMGVNIDERKNR